MKTFPEKLISVVLAFLIALTATIPSFAADNAAWEAMWEKEYENGVILFPGSDNSEINVSWYYSEKADSHVRVSSAPDLADCKSYVAECVEAPDGDYAYKATVTGLEAGKTYFYQCISGDFKSTVYSFETDEKPNEFSAIYMTDIHVSYANDDAEGIEVIKETAGTVQNLTDEAMRKHDASIILSTGDQASEGREDEYKGLASILAYKSVPIATTIGNHDRKGIAYKTFTNLPNEQDDAMVSSYIGKNYWFTKGDVLFLVMDSNNASGMDHRKFIKEAVDANPDAKWKVMMAHHDLYSGRIPHRESENKLLRMIWGPLADEFGIDIVLLGHSHYYTVTNVLYNGKTVQPYSSEMVNPEGTVYQVSGSITRPRDDDDIGLNEEWIGAWNTPDDRQIYNVLDFTADTLTVSAYYQCSDTAFNSYTIKKTSKE
ncbi:MAG: metallophosphoesterase family protein, partial [Clostridia bacterium]|nr:metallophosphoesterase family protein [Clostridia bacterium]